MALDAERNLDLMYKMTNMFFNGTTAFMDVVGSMMEYASSQDPAIKTLRKYMQAGGNLEFAVCKPEYEKELSERLKDAGVTFLQTRDAANGGVNLFVFADLDRKKVEEVLNDLSAEYGKNGITDHATMYAYADGNVREIHNLDRDEAVLFAEHAEKKGIKVLVEEPSKNSFTLSYAQKDDKAINHIKSIVAIELSGEAGRALRKQLQYENDKTVQILDMVKNYERSNVSYLVDLKGSEMEIDNNGITYRGRDGVISVERSEEEFEERTNALILQMKGPVLLNENQKEELDSAVDKKSYLVHMEHENGRPSYTEEEYAAIREMMVKREMYEMKLALAEPEQVVYDICLENDDMRLATFEEFNDINEEAVVNKGEIDPDLMEEIQGRFNSYRDNRCELDYEMVEFQEAVLDGREYEAYEQDAFDLMHDKNNNLIPDEYETGLRE